jgi:inorganic pyrophosphatase
MEINVLIEIPQGGVPVKYELDKISGALFVNRFSPAITASFPAHSLKMAIRVMRWRSRRSQSLLAR